MPSLTYNIHYEIFSLILSIVFYIELYLCMPKNSTRSRFFRQMTRMVILSTVFDLVSAVLNSFHAPSLRLITLLAKTGYLAAGVLLSYMLHHYVESCIVPPGGTHMPQKLSRVLLIVFEGLLAVNLFSGLMFSVNAQGVYVHGPLYLLPHAQSLYFVLCSSAALFLNQALLSPRQRISSYLFTGLYAVGLFLQTFVIPHVLLIMPLASLMLLVAIFSLETPDYVQLQSALRELTDTKHQLEQANEKYFQAAYTDQMTGLKNRSAYVTRMNALEEQLPAESLVILMADLNDLKAINDGFGHLMGDDALIRVARLLLTHFTEGYSCYRIGGDEFAVLGQGVTEESFLQHFRAFQKDIAQANADTPYQLYLATGYQFQDARKADSRLSGSRLSDSRLPDSRLPDSRLPNTGTPVLDEIVRAADEKMYQDKNRVKAEAESASK